MTILIEFKGYIIVITSNLIVVRQLFVESSTIRQMDLVVIYV